jgi:hypothetical protein
MMYAVEMGSRAMIYIASFVKIGSGIQKLMGGFIDTQTAPPPKKNSSVALVR